MRRRTLFKLTSLLFLPFVQARPVVSQASFSGLDYSDSDGNTTFDSLKDGITSSGGVDYAA